MVPTQRAIQANDMVAQNGGNQGLALVTGASSGIGAEFARQLASRGCNLLIVARREERLQALASELRAKHGIGVDVLVLDLAVADAAERARARVERIGQPLKWLINNAGYGLLGPFEQFTIQDYRRYVQVLGMAPIEFMHTLLPFLRRAAPAHIVNVASMAALLPPQPGNALYGGIKSMLLMVSETLALEFELAGTNISVTASCPGLTESEIFEAAQGDFDISKFKNQNFMAVDSVVREALEAAEAGRPLIVHGRLYRVMAFVSRHLPSVMSWYVRRNAKAILRAPKAASLRGANSDIKSVP